MLVLYKLITMLWQEVAKLAGDGKDFDLCRMKKAASEVRVRSEHEFGVGSKESEFVNTVTLAIATYFDRQWREDHPESSRVGASLSDQRFSADQ